jgi:hypothetical protein
MLATDEVIDMPCSACEVFSMGYLSNSCGWRVGSRAYRVNEMVDIRELKCDLNLGIRSARYDISVVC